MLGPVPCQVCRRPVVWDGEAWLFAGSRLIHVPATCPGPTVDELIRADPLRPR
jgi:hypothetical protein